MDKAKIAAVLAAATLTSASFLVGRSLAGGIPSDSPLVYSGVLEDGNGPINASRNIEIKLWGKAKAHLCTTLPQRVALVNGRFSLTLPADCVEAVNREPEVEIEVLVDGGPLERKRLGVVPYALQAGHATTASNAGSATTAESAAIASAAKGALDDRIKAVESSAVAVERHQWGYIECQPLANLRQDDGKNILIRASLWTDAACTNTAHVPNGCHEFCASHHFTERADDAGGCCGVQTYYTNGVVELLVIKPAVPATP